MEEMRIQKYLSECGVLSRRAAEEEIKKGKVEINGKKAVIGQKVIPEVDEILYNGIKITGNKDKRLYIMFYKPAGVVTTMKDEHDRPCVGDFIKDIGEHIYPVGRLDMYSEGLLILTNDGEVSNKIMHPKNEVTKVYHATLKGILSAEKIKKLGEPIEIDGRMTKKAEVSVVECKNAKTRVKFEITEGRNRQIRRMCEENGEMILKLKRICLGKLNIGMLRPGEWKHLNHNEVEYLKGL